MDQLQVEVLRTVKRRVQCLAIDGPIFDNVKGIGLELGWSHTGHFQILNTM